MLSDSSKKIKDVFVPRHDYFGTFFHFSSNAFLESKVIDSESKINYRLTGNKNE